MRAIVFMIGVVLLGWLNSPAQECKIGGVYLDSLEKYYPDRKRIDEQINKYRFALINYGENLKMAMKVINKEYISNLSCSPAVKHKYEVEWMKVAGRMDEFEHKAKTVFQRYQKEHKVFERKEIDEAIAAVANEKELQWVIDFSSLLFGPVPEDITGSVLVYLKSRFTAEERNNRWDNFRQSLEKEFYSWLSEP